MKPTTDVEAMTAKHHRARGNDHDWAPGCCEVERLDRLEAEDDIAELTELGWLLRPAVSLPREAPRGDPATAAARIEDLSERQHSVYLTLHWFGPFSDEELVAAYGDPYGDGQYEIKPPQTPQSIRSRRAELVRAGHVVATGERRPTKAGGSAAVWAARDAEASGRAA